MKSGHPQPSDSHATNAQFNNNQLTVAAASGVTQGKDSLIVIIQPDGATTSDYDSAIGGGISIITDSSRVSHSDNDFSGSYL